MDLKMGDETSKKEPGKAWNRIGPLKLMSGLALLALFVFLIFVLSGQESELKISSEMRQFMKEVNKTHSLEQAALKFNYFGTVPLKGFDVEDPIPLKMYENRGKTCYIIRFDFQFTNLKVSICWAEGEIVSMDDA